MPIVSLTSCWIRYSMKIDPSRVILAAMAGITDGEFAARVYSTGLVGRVTIGGYAIGKEMTLASKQSTQRGRDEFIFPGGEEAKFIAHELEKIPQKTDVIINVRSNNSEESFSFIKAFSDRISIYPLIEVNAHCRQQEILDKGGGENLVHRPKILSNIISVFKSQDFLVSLKIRGNTVDPRSFSKILNRWEVDYLHIDSYRDGEEGTDLNLLNQFSEHCRAEMIGNNSVIDQKSARAILDTGVNFFSVARAAGENPEIFRIIVKGL